MANLLAKIGAQRVPVQVRRVLDRGVARAEELARRRRTLPYLLLQRSSRCLTTILRHVSRFDGCLHSTALEAAPVRVITVRHIRVTEESLARFSERFSFDTIGLTASVTTQ